jgi:hypothetical protein
LQAILIPDKQRAKKHVIGLLSRFSIQLDLVCGDCGQIRAIFLA